MCLACGEKIVGVGETGGQSRRLKRGIKGGQDCGKKGGFAIFRPPDDIATDGHLAQRICVTGGALEIKAQRGGDAAKVIGKTDINRILQAGPRQFAQRRPVGAQPVEISSQAFDLSRQARKSHPRRDVAAGGEAICRRMVEIGVVIRVDRRVRAIFRAKPGLVRQIGEYLIEVHIEGNPAAAMEGMDRKRLGAWGGQQVRGCIDQRLTHRGLNRAGVDIDPRCGLFDHQHRVQKGRVISKALLPFQRVKPYSAFGLDAENGVQADIKHTNTVTLDACVPSADHESGSPPRWRSGKSISRQ